MTMKMVLNFLEGLLAFLLAYSLTYMLAISVGMISVAALNIGLAVLVSPLLLILAASAGGFLAMGILASTNPNPTDMESFDAFGSGFFRTLVVAVLAPTLALTALLLSTGVLLGATALLTNPIFLAAIALSVGLACALEYIDIEGLFLGSNVDKSPPPASFFGGPQLFQPTPSAPIDRNFADYASPAFG